MEPSLANALVLERAEALSDETLHPTLSYLITSLEAILELGLTKIQEENLEKIIKDRFRNRIGPIRARRLIHMPTIKNGAGLRPGRAREFQSYVEMLILIASERRAVEETKRSGNKEGAFPADNAILPEKNNKDSANNLGSKISKSEEKKETEAEIKSGSECL